MRLFVGGYCILAVVLLAFGCGRSDPAPNPTPSAVAAPGDTPADPKALFEQTCTSCHTTLRIENHKGTRWDEVVKRMVDRNGAKIAPENAANIVSYLKKTYPQAAT